MVTIYAISGENICTLFKKENIDQSWFLSSLNKKTYEHNYIYICEGEIFLYHLFYVVFQINQSEKSSTRLLIDNEIYQWSKVNNFFC